MAKLGDLKYELILDDSKFENQVKRDIETAKKMNLELSNYLKVKRKIQGLSAEEYQTMKRLDNLASNRRRNAEKEAEMAARRALQEERLKRAIEGGTKSMSQRNKLMREVTTLMGSYFSIMGAERLVSSIVNVTGEFEKQRVALRAILRDVSGADAIFDRIKSLSVISPFRFKELVEYTKQLSAFSVPMNELYDTTKMLADVSAGLGVDMSRLVLAYGQVRSAAFLRGQEVRQFTEAGIPILEELGKQIQEMEGHAVSAAEVFDRISKRQISFEMVAKVFKDLTSEGGKFYKMQETLADTLAGKISNLGDAFDIMFDSIGEKNLGVLKGTIEVVTNLAKNYEKVGAVLISMAAAYGVARTGITAYLLVTKKLEMSQVGVVKALKSTGEWLAKNKWGAYAAAVAAAVGVITAIVVSLDNTNKMMKAVNDTMAQFNANVDNERIKLDYLFGRLGKLTAGTAEYNDVKKQIIQSYGQYLNDVDMENLKVGNLIPVYDKLIDKVTEYNRARAMESGMSKISEEFNTQAEEHYKWFNNQLKKLTDPKRDAAVIQQLRDYFSGKIEKSGLTKEALAVYDKFPKAAKAVGGFYESVNDLDVARDKMIGIGEDAKQAATDLADMLEVLYSVDKPEGTPLNDWQKKIEGITSGIKGLKIDDIKVDAGDTLTDYVKKLSNLRDNLNKSILIEKDNDNALFKQDQARLKVIEDINQALNGAIDKYKETNKDGSIKGAKSGGKSEEEKELDRRIKLLKTMQKIYEDFKALGFADDTIRKILKDIPSLADQEGAKAYIEALEFDKQLMEMAGELAKYNPTSAASLLDSLGLGEGKDLAKDVKDAYSSLEKLHDMLSEFFDKNYTLDGEGIQYEFQKIANEYMNAASKIDDKMSKAKDLLWKARQGDRLAEAEVVTKYGQEFWNDYVVNGEAAIDRISAYEREQLKKSAQEKLNGLAEKYVKETLFVNDVDMSDLGDKSMFQLRRLRRQLQDTLDKSPLQLSVETQGLLRNNGVDLDYLAGGVRDSVEIYATDLDALFSKLEAAGTPISEAEQNVLRMMKALQAADLSTVKFGETVKKVLQGKLKDLTEEEMKELSSKIREYVAEIGNMMKSISDYANAAGNTSLGSWASAFSEVIDTLGGVAEKLSRGDVLGAVIAGVSSLTQKLFETLAAQERIKQAVADTAREQRILNSQKAIESGTENIFGEDNLKRLNNAYKEALNIYPKIKKEMSEADKVLTGGFDNDVVGKAEAAGTAAGAAFGAAIGALFAGIGAPIGAAIGAGVGLIAGAITDGIKVADNYTMTLKQAAAEIGADLIDDKTGVYSEETLQKILDTYDNLDKKTREWIENTLADIKIYNQALESIEDVMSDIFDSIADDVANTLVDSWKEAGMAALEYADIISDVASTIAQAVVKSTLMENVFNDDLAKEAAKQLANGNVGAALQLVDEAMQSAEQLVPSIQGFLDSISEYFNTGESAEVKSTSGSLSENVKGVTEDTASLIASYLNAIRADVSYAKVQRGEIVEAMREIAGLLPSSPTLGDYLTQIQANTYDTRMILEEMMLDFRSVMSPYRGGGYGINVNQ